MPTITQAQTFADTARAGTATAYAEGGRAETLPRLARPIQRVIGGPKPVRSADAAELARISMADTRSQQERILNTVMDRLAAAIAEPRPTLRLTNPDGPRRTPPRSYPGAMGIAR